MENELNEEWCGEQREVAEANETPMKITEAEMRALGFCRSDSALVAGNVDYAG